MGSLTDSKFIVNYTDKLLLPNSDEIEVVEAVNIEPKSDINITTTSFKINKVSKKPIKTTTIFLTNNNEYVGHISANIYDNNTASLSMSGIQVIPLPSDLDAIRKYILDVKHQDVALLVDEKYRNKGKAKELIFLMFDYLIKQGINDVLVTGISNEIAMKTYISTGAIKTGDNTAVYNNIKDIFNCDEQSKIM